MFDIFNFQVRKLEYRLKTKILKNKIIEFYVSQLRNLFMRWFQITRPRKMTEKATALSMNLIEKVIKKFTFNFVVGALKNLRIKNFKNKFIRRLLWR